jgi:hypothetical protein
LLNREAQFVLDLIGQGIGVQLAQLVEGDARLVVVVSRTFEVTTPVAAPKSAA